MIDTAWALALAVSYVRMKRGDRKMKNQWLRLRLLETGLKNLQEKLAVAEILMSSLMFMNDMKN